MISDIDESPDGQSWSCDLCIVGAGAAGIALALELQDSGVDVLLLEAGDETENPANQALYEGTVQDERLHSPPDRYRQRRFGGTTTIWGGRCMPFDPIDFEARDAVPSSGWPISFEALAPYYPKANRLSEAGEFAYDVAHAFDRPLRPMIDGFESRHFTTDTLERFSCPTDFGARYQHKLRAATNIRVLLNANVTAVRLAPTGATVESLSVRSRSGKAWSVRARRFVLATGGLEVARLLLASRDIAHAGIGNEHDVVGRYYMCHLAGSIGTLVFDGPRESVSHDYDVSDEGIYCRRRIALTAGTQRERGLGNFVARLHHPRITDPAHRTGMLSLLALAKAFVPYEYSRRLHGEERTTWSSWLLHVRNVILDPFGTARFLWHFLRKRTFAERKFPTIVVHPHANRYSLDFHAEQFPFADSRVTLGEDTDAFGVPKLHVDWRYTPADVVSVQATLALLQHDLAESGVGRFDYDPATVEAEMTRYGAYGGHHVGTARMGTDPRTSVVDADCRVHGIDNLFIASSAVFTTSSQANPTLTIVALALRLAAHLKLLARADGDRAARQTSASFPDASSPIDSKPAMSPAIAALP